MNRADRKKLTANEMYLNECIAILDGRIRAMGFNFFNEDGSLKPINHLSIESYNHGTITCICGKNLIQVNWDGTNFNPIFVTKDAGNFIYKLKPLGIEYYYSERKLNEVVYEKKICRKVGNSSEFFRFLLCGSMSILLDYCGYDENGKTTITNTKVSDYTDMQLIDYIQEQMQIAEEIEQEQSEQEPLTERVRRIFEELAADSMDDFVEDHPILGDEFTPAELEEIDAYVTDDPDADIFDIDYSLDKIFLQSDDDTPYDRGSYPDRIEDFDYQKFIRSIKSGTDEDEVVYSVGPSDESAQEYEEEDVTTDSGYDEEFDGQDGIYDEDDGTYSEDTEISSDEFIMDDSHFVVTRNGEGVEGELRSDIIDDISESVMDVNQESLTLRDIQYDFMSEIRKMRAIIIRRRELLVKRKAGQSGSDVSDSGKKGDKDIED